MRIIRVEGDQISHGGENNLIVNRQDKVVRDQINVTYAQVFGPPV